MSIGTKNIFAAARIKHPREAAKKRKADYLALTLPYGRGESETDIIEKMGYREAIRESVRTRMRPIFMTSAAAIIGMVPLVATSGAGSELYRGIGFVVIGGLVCSTIFTLFVVPLMLSLMIDLQYALAKMFGKSDS